MRPIKDGSPSAAEKIEKGQIAIQALADYRKAVKDKDQVAAGQARTLLDENFAYFGYGYIKDPATWFLMSASLFIHSASW